MHFLPSHWYDGFGNCSSMIRNLVYNLEGRQDLLANTVVNVAAVAKAKEAAACHRHKEAERRRRKRINGHLATLRSILPNTVKADKASLLAETVHQVKELKKTVAKFKSTSTYQSNETIQNYECHMIPSENDELELLYVEDSSTNKIMIKVTISCEDRPELIVELMRALGSVYGNLVRAEIVTLGGRLKCVLWVQVSEVTRDRGLVELRDALKAVTNHESFLYLPKNKRPRFSECASF